MGEKTRSHKDLEVYRRAFATSMKIFRLSKHFPKEETYSLTDQIRRSSRSVCSNLAEAWRKRRYEGSFVAKVSDAESEGAETQVWLEFAVECEYLDRVVMDELYAEYDAIIGTLVGMMTHSDSWVLPSPSRKS